MIGRMPPVAGIPAVPTIATEAAADMPPSNRLDPDVPSAEAAAALVELYDSHERASRLGIIRNASLTVHGERPAHVLEVWARRLGIASSVKVLPSDRGDQHRYEYVKVELYGGASISAHREPIALTASSAA